MILGWEPSCANAEGHEIRTAIINAWIRERDSHVYVRYFYFIRRKRQHRLTLLAQLASFSPNYHPSAVQRAFLGWIIEARTYTPSRGKCNERTPNGFDPLAAEHSRFLFSEHETYDVAHVHLFELAGCRRGKGTRTYSKQIR